MVEGSATDGLVVLVVDDDDGDLPAVAGGPDQLHEGVDAVEQSRGIGTGDGGRRTVDRDAVRLGRATGDDGEGDGGGAVANSFDPSTGSDF